MRTLELPRVPPSVRLLDGTPVAALLVLAGAWLAATATLPPAGARVAGLAAAHGALLGTALAWAAREGAPARWAPLSVALLLAAAATCARVAPWGALAYLALPAWLLWRRPDWLGGVRGQGRALAAGALFGALLGAHLLVNASLTLGYHVRAGGAAAVTGWLAYDAFANVLAAEAFFRGGLFARAHRRWPLAGAAALATAASVARYLADPLLPHSAGMLAGATFYLALLCAGNCVLLARSGSLAAPLAAGVVFFTAYRLLAPR